MNGCCTEKTVPTKKQRKTRRRKEYLLWVDVVTVLEGEEEETNDGPPSIKLTDYNREDAVRFAEGILNLLLDGQSHKPRPTAAGTHFMSLHIEEHNPGKDEYKDVEFGLLGGCFSGGLPFDEACREIERITEWIQSVYDTKQWLKKHGSRQKPQG